MPVWLIALLAGGAVPAIATVCKWMPWLRFAARIAEKHGVEGLRALPPLATSFRTGHWRIGLPRRGNTPPPP